PIRHAAQPSAPRCPASSRGRLWRQTSPKGCCKSALAGIRVVVAESAQSTGGAALATPRFRSYLASVQARQRINDTGTAVLCRLATRPLLLDHLFGRLCHELLIAELLVDLGDLGIELADLLVETRPLGAEVDHPRQG